MCAMMSDILVRRRRVLKKNIAKMSVREFVGASQPLPVARRIEWIENKHEMHARTAHVREYK